MDGEDAKDPRASPKGPRQREGHDQAKQCVGQCANGDASENGFALPRRDPSRFADTEHARWGGPAGRSLPV